MGAIPYVGRIIRALQFKQQNEFWGAIGRTTAWVNESVPPDFSLSATNIDEPIVYVKASIVSLAAIVQSGENIIINGNKYAYVSDANAYANDARYLVLVFTVDPALGHPVANFRQIGFFANLIPITGHTADLYLLPANVSSVGKMIYIHNDTITTMASNRQEEIKIALEFE
jgi:hypothetical protein